MKKWFYRLSIRNKITGVYFVLICPVLLLLSISVVVILRSVIFRNIEMSVNNNAEVIVSQIEGKMQNTESCANMMLAYLNELDFLREDYGETLNWLARHNMVLKQMMYAFQTFKDVDHMVFIDREGNVYGNNIAIEDIYQKQQPLHLSYAMSKKGGEAVWFPMHRENSLPDEASTLTMGKNIVDIWTGERLGVLLLMIEERSMSNLYASLKLSENSHYVIVDEEGMIVSSSVTEELGAYISVPVEGEYRRGEYTYACGFEKIPYHLIFRAPLRELMHDIYRIIIYISIIGAVCIGVAIWLAFLLARRITRPIDQLTQSMAEVALGDLNIRCYSKAEDETRLLADGFNDMLDTIAGLICHVEEEQTAKRKFELALIQSQIKPHFLYNTLDTIYVLAHMGRTEEAKRTTKALADFYHVALSSGKEIISLGEEIRCVNEYLKIQKVRYEEDFSYVIDVSESFYDYAVLKLSIQPLVENAIYHGLKEKQEKGLLEISAYEKEDMLCVQVKDDGIGITRERLEQVLLYETNNSFGLKNVNDRIKLFFGEEYGLDIQSEQGKGTTITVYMPKQTGGDL